MQQQQQQQQQQHVGEAHDGAVEGRVLAQPSDVGSSQAGEQQQQTQAQALQLGLQDAVAGLQGAAAEAQRDVGAEAPLDQPVRGEALTDTNLKNPVESVESVGWGG